MLSKASKYLAKHSHQNRIAQSNQIQVTLAYKQVDPQVHQCKKSDMIAQHSSNMKHQVSTPNNPSGILYAQNNTLDFFQQQIARSFEEYAETQKQEQKKRKMVKKYPIWKPVMWVDRKKTQREYYTTQLLAQLDQKFEPARVCIARAKKNMTKMMKRVRQEIGSTNQEAVLVPRVIVGSFLMSLKKRILITKRQIYQIAQQYEEVIQKSIQFKDSCVQWNKTVMKKQHYEMIHARDAALQAGQRVMIAIENMKGLINKAQKMAIKRIRWPQNFDMDGEPIPIQSQEEVLIKRQK